MITPKFRIKSGDGYRLGPVGRNMYYFNGFINPPYEKYNYRNVQECAYLFSEETFCGKYMKIEVESRKYALFLYDSKHASANVSLNLE